MYISFLCRKTRQLKIRLIDAGRVSYLRSQTIYHALAYAKKANTADTIVIDIPKEPYVCTGFHRDLEQEVDLNFCEQNNIPIIRRETGGGTVYLDENQVFTQWIFEPKHLPVKTDSRFQLFIKPLVDTYQHFGINARYFYPNDVHVGNRKIVGTGAAAIGNAEVVTGNFLFDFDNEMMAKILKVPNENFRKEALESLQKYMTSIKRELGELASIEELKKVYIKNCATTLGREIVVGDFTDEEYRIMEELDKKFLSKEWTFQFTSKQAKKRTVKIHADVWLYNVSKKTDKGNIDLVIRTKGKRIDQININGVFDFQPERKLKDFEKVLHNVEVSKESLTEIVDAFYGLHRIESSGISTADWVEAILQIN